MPACQPEPTRPARAQLAALRAAARLTRPPRHRGFGTAVSVLGRRVFPAGTSCPFSLAGGELPVELADRYWMRLLLPTWRYEPEVATVLATALDGRTVFVDGGANIGFWSVQALGRVGDGGVIAVEASPRTHARLARTAAANGGRFAAVHAALWDEPGLALALDFDPERHGRARVAPAVGAAGTVPTTTVDRLVADHGRPGARVVVKLDVEGAEVPALRGAAATLAAGAVVVYEDHGRDRGHAVTRHLLEDQGLAVARWDDDRGGLVPVGDAAELDAVKVHTWKGYNLVAGDLAPVRDLLVGPRRPPTGPRVGRGPQAGVRST